MNPLLQQQVGSLVQDDEQLKLQYLVTACKGDGGDARSTLTANPRPIRVLALMPAIEWTGGDIRIRRPLMEWQARYGGDVRFVTPETFLPDDVRWSDVIVVQRIAEPSMCAHIQQLHEKGKKVLFELDDLLTDVPLFLETGHYYEVVRPYLETILRTVDHVTVATPVLAEQLDRYNANISIIPNVVSEAPFEATHNDSDPIHLIVASSDTAHVDLIVPALRELTCRHANTRIVAIGPPADTLVAAGLDIIRSNSLSYPEVGRYISGWSNPVGIIPLDDSVFSSCKNPVEYLDYSSHGIPVIASNVVPYADVIEHGVTGMLIDNETTDWVEGIESLLVWAARRSAIAAQARDYVRENFSLLQSATLWNEVIERALPEGAKTNAVDTVASLNRRLPTGEAGRISEWMEANFGSRAGSDVTAFHTTPDAHWKPQHIEAVKYLQDRSELAFLAEDGSVSIQGFATFDTNEDIVALRHVDGQVRGMFFRSDGGEWVEIGKVARVAYKVAAVNQELSGRGVRTRLSQILAHLHHDVDLNSLHAVAVFPREPGWAPEHLEAVDYLRRTAAPVVATKQNGRMRFCCFSGFDPTTDIMAIVDDSGAVPGVFFQAQDDTWIELGEFAEVVHPRRGKILSIWLYSRFLRPRSYLSLLRLLMRSGPQGVAKYLRDMGILR